MTRGRVIQETKHMPKAELARHIGQPHGGCSDITPMNERLRWSRDELEACHRWLLKKGPCNTFTRSEAVGE